MSNWQPIETAPKDGSRVMLFDSFTKSVELGWWDSRSSEWVMNPDLYEGRYFVVNAAYWMPLPAPPADGVIVDDGGQKR